MKEFDVVIEISCFGQAMEVSMSIYADDADDARRSAEEKARDNTLFFASAAESDDQ